MADDIVKADRLRRVPVAKEDRTPDKSEAAVWIESLWPATLTDIADESGFARSHIRNTLDMYFEVAEMTAPDDKAGVVNVANAPDPDRTGVDTAREPRDQYRQGYRDGFRDALRELRDDADAGDAPTDTSP